MESDSSKTQSKIARGSWQAEVTMKTLSIVCDVNFSGKLSDHEVVHALPNSKVIGYSVLFPSLHPLYRYLHHQNRIGTSQLHHGTDQRSLPFQLEPIIEAGLLPQPKKSTPQPAPASPTHRAPNTYCFDHHSTFAAHCNAVSPRLKRIEPAKNFCSSDRYYLNFSLSATPIME